MTVVYTEPPLAILLLYLDHRGTPGADRQLYHPFLKQVPYLSFNLSLLFPFPV